MRIGNEFEHFKTFPGAQIDLAEVHAARAKFHILKPLYEYGLEDKMAQGEVMAVLKFADMTEQAAKVDARAAQLTPLEVIDTYLSRKYTEQKHDPSAAGSLIYQGKRSLVQEWMSVLETTRNNMRDWQHIFQRGVRRVKEQDPSLSDAQAISKKTAEMLELGLDAFARIDRMVISNHEDYENVRALIRTFVSNETMGEIHAAMRKFKEPTDPFGILVPTGQDGIDLYVGRNRVDLSRSKPYSRGVYDLGISVRYGFDFSAEALERALHEPELRSVRRS